MTRLRIIACCCFALIGAVMPLRITHAANTCFDEYTSQGKFTSQDCLDQVKDVKACQAVGSSLVTCSGPAGSLAALSTGNTNLLLSSLAQPLVDALGQAVGTGTPTCAQLIPYYTYIVGQCQAANPDKFCGELGQGPGGCCIIKQETTQTVGGPCTNETEQCSGKTPIYYSCCYCQKAGEGDTLSHLAANSGQTYESCAEICKTPPLSGTISHALGAGTLQHQAAAPSASQIQEQAMYCFTSVECTTDPYNGRFQPGAPGCQAGEGKCIAPEPELQLSSPIGGVKSVRGFRSFVSTVFQFLIGAVGTVAAVMFVYAGFRYIFGSAFEDIKRAKEIMVDATIGLILVLSTIAILRTVNPMTLNLNVLEVFMINQSRILNAQYCKDISSSKPLALAKAGAAPDDIIPFGGVKDADYTLKQEETACGESYYVKGFGDFTCAGLMCPGGKGICHKCSAPGDCAEGTKKGASVCEEGNFGGNISYTDCRYVNAIHLFAVCDGLSWKYPYVVKSPNVFTGKIENMPFEPASDAIIDIGSRDWTSSEKNFNKTSVASTEDKGSKRYLWNLTQEDIDKAVSGCAASKGPQGAGNGVTGFVLGIKFQDPGVTTAVSCGSIFSNDDYAIVGKNNCNGGLMDGYMQGNAQSAVDTRAYKQALWCSMYTPGGPFNKNEWWKTTVWSWDEVQGAVDGSKPAIQCNFTLTADNALVNPISKETARNSGKVWLMKDFPCPIVW